jgi:GTP pyrophosphokinase
MLSERLSQALALAIEAHNGQFRKETTIPYIAHPMAVASIALEYGADEDQAMAALLHDAVEDGGAKYAEIIRSKFGDRVADIVNGCTDGVPDNNGIKPPWKQRKESYIAHLKSAPDDVLLVSGSDKLHNARAIVSDLKNIGLRVFDRFSSSKTDTLWYYQSLADIFKTRNTPTAKALSETVAQMHALAK